MTLVEEKLIISKKNYWWFNNHEDANYEEYVYNEYKDIKLKAQIIIKNEEMLISPQ